MYHERNRDRVRIRYTMTLSIQLDICNDKKKQGRNLETCKYLYFNKEQGIIKTVLKKIITMPQVSMPLASLLIYIVSQKKKNKLY